MPTAPNTSFIPKRGPAKHSRQTVSRQVHLFSIFSYLLFSATLVATVGVFFYSNYIDKLRLQEITNLRSVIVSFNEPEMERVLKFDSRLRQAQERVNNSVSTVSIFEALESATVQTIEIKSLSLKRDLDSQFNIVAEVYADSFDSTRFQREVFERNSVIESVAISELEIVSEKSDETTVNSGVSFTATLGVPVSSVPYVPVVLAAPAQPVDVVSDIATGTEEAMAEEDVNQNEL